MPPLTPNIGYLQVIASIWGEDENGDYFYEDKVLETHTCTDEDF